MSGKKEFTVQEQANSNASLLLLLDMTETTRHDRQNHDTRRQLRRRDS